MPTGWLETGVLPSEDGLRKLDLSSLEKRRLWRCLTAATQHLWGDHQGCRARVLTYRETWCENDRQQVMKQERFRLNVWRKILATRTESEAASLRGCAVSILRGFKKQLYQALRILV